MKHSLLVLFSATLIGIGCSGHKEIQPLSYTGIFNKDSVKEYLAIAPSAFADSSKKLFLKAVDLLKNKKKAEASVPLFIQSLELYPTASGYYELGNALMANENAYNDADFAFKAYSMAELMDYKPWSHVLFQKACAASVSEDSRSSDFLTYAIMNGFVHRDKVLTNKFLLKYHSQEELNSIYVKAMAGNGDADVVLWEGYSKQFGQAAFPFAIDSGTFASIGETVSISYDFEKFIPEMRDYKFSRDVGKDFFYFTRVNDNKVYKTVIYGAQLFEAEDASPVSYTLASFTPTGRLIDKKVIAGQLTLDSAFRECSFASNNEFEVKEYQNVYEKDTEKEGYANNPIVKRDLLNTYKYSIDSTGRFIKL
ncbi:hypothetical protein HNQ91_004173 [Filimonas zeae]|uniref:Uncharacterized protein n=1 Tax=Filimonas zeae TaxID=1737353 RepID=A0A917MXW4_9BACT|nr:hypothetical protein [Filimonas zeae]MDR6341100.1 hypothetical protein [Filimonas zeae]GGH77228.1 hypothetical protein GCM10011379_43260 [Filimonas zeae]